MGEGAASYLCRGGMVPKAGYWPQVSRELGEVLRKSSRKSAFHSQSKVFRFLSPF